MMYLVLLFWKLYKCTQVIYCWIYIAILFKSGAVADIAVEWLDDQDTGLWLGLLSSVVDLVNSLLARIMESSVLGMAWVTAAKPPLSVFVVDEKTIGFSLSIG